MPTKITAEMFNDLERKIAYMNPSYNKQIWNPGDIITADKLNNLEDAAENIENIGLSNVLQGKLDPIIKMPENGILPSGSFYHNPNIEYLIIPEGIIELANNSISYCENLKYVKLPSTLKKIGTNFYNCSKLKVLNLPEGIEYLETRFVGDGCGIEKLIIPSTVTTMGTYLEYLHDLEYIKFLNNITSIPSLEYNNKLKTIILPNSLTSFRSNQFYHCHSIKNVNIPSGITELPSYCFGYDYLENQFIPNTIETINNYAFSFAKGNIICDFAKDSIAGAPWGFYGKIEYLR